jgi:murein L,D-transpeptidase YcbB/YkuD
MYRNKYPYCELAFLVICVFLLSCNNASEPKDKQIVSDPDQMDKRAAENIKASLNAAVNQNGKIDDSIRLSFTGIVNDFYNNTAYEPVWSDNEKWKPLADSLYHFIANAELEGLFPNDYHFKNLQSLKNKLDTDSLKRMDATLWTRADLMMTDGFMHIIKDLKLGRLKPDSLSLNKDSVLANSFYITQLKELLDKNAFTSLLTDLQPKYKGYWELKRGIKSFIDSMDRKTYTYVTYPYKKGDAKDSAFFIKTLQRRLSESGVPDMSGRLPDSGQLKAAIIKIQKQKGINADGKISAALIRSLNISDAERFKRIAITLDRYKLMPEKMPVKYIWVNLPGYYLKVIDHDTVALDSKIICGKPDTRTPLLTSQITDMVTYPTWTVPTSIIAKSYLPKLKHNPNYLSKLGLKLTNGKGEAINPAEVNWSKYSRGIPFKVMQASGDNNALGVIKFNFNNPYFVYLHDTNQRYLFKNASRALSHGCVRVQEWQKLAFYIARNDSVNTTRRDSLRYNTDSIRNWIARKQRRRIDVKNQVPLFIRYFSCEGKDGKILFYDDIYGEDKILREKYFANKE